MKDKEELYTLRELQHISVNYAVSCMKGYDGSFENWFKGIHSDWRELLREEDESRGNSDSPPTIYDYEMELADKWIKEGFKGFDEEEMVTVDVPVGSYVCPPLKCNPEFQVLPPIKEPIKNFKMIERELVRWRMGHVVETLKKHNKKLNEIIDHLNTNCQD